MRKFLADIFFALYVPVATSLAAWALYVCDPIRSLFDHQDVPLVAARDAFLFGNLMMVGCVSWIFVYAAELLVPRKKRILWQLGMLLLPTVTPSIFYFREVRRCPSLFERPPRVVELLLALVLGVLAAKVAAVIPFGRPETRQVGAMQGAALVGAMIGAFFWVQRARRVDELFRVMRFTVVGGAGYGLAAGRLMVPFAPQLVVDFGMELVRVLVGVYVGSALTGFGACAVIAVPGLLAEEVKLLLERRRARRE
ncbi:hypothetical protein [Thermopirellula anaerolimosa]